MIPTNRTRRSLAITLLLLAAAGRGFAQEPATPAPTLPTAAEIDSRVQRIQENANLDDTARTRILDVYKQVRADVQAADEWRAKAAEWNRLREEAPQRQQELEASLDAPVPPEPTEESTRNQATDQIGADVTNTQQQVDAAKTALAALQAEADGRVERRRQLPDMITRARQRLTEAKAAAAPAADIPPEEADALRVANQARIEALNAEIDAYAAETASYEARGRLLPLRIDQAELNERVAENRLNALRTILTARQQEDARQAAEDARDLLMQAVNAPPAVRERIEAIARKNEELVSRQTGADGIIELNAQAEQTIKDTQRRTSQLTSELDRIRRREAAVGLNNALGQLLRTFRGNLPPRNQYRVSMKLREDTIDEAQLAQIEIEETRRGLDIDHEINEVLNIASFAADAPARREEEVRALLRELLTSQRLYLDQLSGKYETYITNLIALNAAEQELLVQRDAASEYIDERVLWIRSGTVISGSDFREAFVALQWLVNYKTWKDVGASLLNDVRQNPIINLLALLAIAGTVLLNKRMKARLRDLGDRAEKRSCTTYMPTLEALLYTILLSAWVPGIMAYVAWRMNASLAGGEFVRMLSGGLVVMGGEFVPVFSNGLFIVAVFYFSLELPRWVLTAKGLGESHFDWPEYAAQFAKQTIGWLIPVALPVILLIALFETQGQQQWRESVGRLAFFVMMVVWAYLGHRFAKHKSPALQLFEVMTPTGGVSSFRGLLYVLAAGAPMALAIAAGVGYYYTALRLAWRIHATLTLLFLIAVGVNLAMRALLIARRRIAIDQARRKRAELKAAQKKAKDEGGEPIAAVEIQEPEIDLTQLDAQTGRLIRSVGVIVLFTGLWFTWIDFIPALRILDDIVILKSSAPLESLAKIGSGADAVTPTGEALATDAATAVTTKGQLTLADLLFSIVVASLTWIAYRNLPALLEIAILQRLPLAPGERYAIKTVLGYPLVLIGSVIALAALGIQWGSVQWLVAALGFGIGFGLQEIIANFISGLIILFEQPIRVGDTVTIGNVNGTVTRIRIRATTITDWDLKELVVPNKEFVTGQLVNWSLSNPTLRVIVPVGVAYGTDTRLVRETLFRVAERCRRVLKQPPPQVWFTSFGDSALIFELRIFIAGIEDFLPVQDDVNHDIAAAFREKGIEIAFPQQDVHIRSIAAPLTVHGEPVPDAIQEQ